MKKRQLEREREREALEAERAREQRDKESDYYTAWEKQEDKVGITIYICSSSLVVGSVSCIISSSSVRLHTIIQLRTQPSNCYPRATPGGCRVYVMQFSLLSF